MNVPKDAIYLTDGASLNVKVEVSKAGYTAANPVNHTLSVDLVAPSVTYPAAPGSLKVDVPISLMNPTTSDGDNAYSSTSLPDELIVHPTTGVISGTPSTANADAVEATVTITDGAGNTIDVAINFPAVLKGEQPLSGFKYTPATLTYGAASQVTAPAGATETLKYTTTTTSVCTVDEASGALTILDAGTCTITVTAPAGDNHKVAAETFSVTVNVVSKLALNLADITGDNTINIVEKGAGFTIEGNTGTVDEVEVAVTIGSENPLKASSAKAQNAGADDLATWSVSVSQNAAYLSAGTVVVAVSAAKAGYTAANPVNRNLSVDLAAPSVSYNTLPASLQVGVAISSMSPSSNDADKASHSYSGVSLPKGLSIDANTGEITGVPTAAGAAATAAVTVTDGAGNPSSVMIDFPRVIKGAQTLSGFGYGANSQNFDSTPVLAAPAGAAAGVTLAYTTTTPAVCTVDSASGVLNFEDAGECTITVTAPGNDDYNLGTKSVTVTVQPLGTLTLNVTAITGDSKINFAEKTSGFTIEGNTGTVAGVSVKVTIGTQSPVTLPITNSAKALDALSTDLAAWSVNVPKGAIYLTGGASLNVKVEVSKAGYTAANPVNHTLSVDLVAPSVTYPAAPGSLKVDVPISLMNPTTSDGDNAYSSTSLPDGLTVHPTTGVISGTPSTANADAVEATVTITDGAGNTIDVAIKFPVVLKGEQPLSGFKYTPATLTYGPTPQVTAPAGATETLKYTTTTTSVCTVDEASGALTILDAGTCTITVTAPAGDNHKVAADTFSVTVNVVSKLALSVAKITGDDTINIVEKGTGFMIEGNTGTVDEVEVAVTIGSENPLRASSAKAQNAQGADDLATWSVSVSQNAAYLSAGTVVVAVSAAKAGYTAANPVNRNLSVDLAAPSVSYNTLPASLQVGVAISSMSPSSNDADKASHSYSGVSLPKGLSIAAKTGEITGAPTAAGAAATAAVTVTDAAGNPSSVMIDFPRVIKGAQTLSGFGYGANSQNFDGTPVLAAPAGAAAGVTLAYTTTTPTVCTVHPTTGKLKFEDAGECTITVTAPGNDDYNEGTKTVTVTVLPEDNRTDYDDDDDGLIEIRTLEQLNAMRWDLNGDADPSSDAAAYAAAFPDSVADTGAGNGALGCSNGGSASACTGYELKADLDFKDDASYADSVSNKAGWTTSTGWAPIGDNSGQFAATFDGNGHSIANLFINRSSERVGLFGHADSSARLRNLGLKDVDVTGTQRVGALAGRLEGRVERCHASGTVKGTATGKVGGLVGDNQGGSISASYARVAVTGVGANIGGLVGRNKGSVEVSFAAGAVKGDRLVGGLVGNQIGSTLKAVYAAGAVEGSADRVGGLVGNNEGAITAGYATGVVSGSSDVGGLVGRNSSGSATVSYWDTEASSKNSSAQGVGKSTTELQTPIRYDGIYTNWDLDLDSNVGGDDPWDFGDASQYPALKADLNGDGMATVAEFGGGLGHQAVRKGVAVSKIAVTVGEDSDTEDYTVVLRTEPAADVVVALASGDTNAAAVAPPSLRFTPANWSMAQIVTVTGVNDSIDNAGDVRETAITYTVSSTDSDYDNIAVPPLAVVVADDDTAALALSVSPETLAEDDSAVEVTVRARLSGAAIHGDLVLPLTLDGTARAGADYQVNALPVITIAGGNTTATAPLSITPLDDAINEGNETIAIGVAHARFGTAAPAQVVLTDDDTAAGLALSVDPATLAEGAGATDVTVTATLPGANSSGSEVVLPLNFSGSAAKGVDYILSGTESVTILSGVPSGTTRLSITPDDDAIDEGLGEIVEIGTTYNNKQVAAALLLTDDDDGAPALSIEMAAGYSSTDPIPVRFVFPEPVTDFASDDVTVSAGGTLGALSTTDGGRTYLSEVTPGSPIPDSITVTVRRDAVTDPSGNTGPAAPVVKTALYDTTVPTLEIRGLPTALHGAEPLVLVFRFSEPVEFGSGDVEVVNGQVTDFSGDGAVYLVTVTPDSGGALSVRVKRDAVADGAGNTVVPIPETAAQADGELTLSKRIVKTPGRYLQSNPRLVLPAGMVVQGAEVRYQTSLPQNSPLNVGSTTYSYAFVRKQGDVKFLAQDDDGDTATNRFRADWYGENLVEVTATDGNGKKATALDRVFVHFASRRVLGGNAEGLTDAQRLNMHRDNIHDVSKANPGMAFVLPGMDGSSEEGRKGFYQCKETRSLVTSRGTLLTVCHVGRRTGESPFFEVPWGMAVAVSRSADYGNSWSNQLLTPHDGDVTWAYTGMVEAKGVVYVYVQRVSCRSGVSRSSCSSLTSSGTLRESYYFTSGDDGRTWSSGRRQAQLSTARMTMNPVHVPGLRVDGVQAPPGEGLMAHTREENASAGYLWLSVNGGKTWKQARSSGRYNNEVGLARLENDAQHIYMVVRTNYKYDFSFKNEIVFRKGGSNGIEVVADHRQSLSNITNRSTHHWLNVIHSGPLKGTVLFSTIGPVVVDDKHEYSHTGSWNHSRNHIRLLVSREAITGAKTISAGLFDEVHVMDSMGWGQSTVQYLPADLPNSVGMGGDAFVLIGESEPIHRETYQAIDLKPDRAHRGWFHERFTNTAYLLSKEYLDQLRAVKHRVALGVSTAAGKIDSEAAGSADSFTVRAWRSLGDALDRDLVLPLTFGGDATQGEDYEVTGDPEVTILSGARFGKTTMTITPTQDTIDEGVFEHIELSAEPAPGLTVAMVRVTLVDDDVHDLTLSANPSELVEGAVATEVTVTATLPAAASGKVTLPLSFAGSAARDVDYRLSGTGEIEIVSGQTSGSTVLTITPLADGVAEVFRENIEVRADHNGDKSAVHVLLIDSPVGVVVSEATVTMGEDGGTATYRVALGSASAVNVRVTPVSGDTAVATVSRPLTFTPDNWSTAQPVTVTGVNDSDDNVGDRRTTTITHTVTSTDTDYAGAAVSEVAVVVDDDDTATLALSVNPATLAEGASAANVMVKATLTGAVLDANLALPLTLGGTAQAGVDYTVSGTAPTLTILEGDAEATASLMIVPVDDAVAEGAEMIAIGVAHARFGATAPAAVELTDNDDAGLTLALNRATLAEGDGATDVTVTAALSNGATAGSGGLTLPLTLGGVAARGVDYTVSGTESITITQGSASGETTLSIDPAGDSVDEGPGELIEVGTTHSNKQVAATLFLTDDDAGAPALSIEMAAGYSSADPIAVRFVFPEPVTDFASDDVTVSAGGTLGVLATTDGGRTYLSKVAPGSPIPDSITVTVRRDAVTDQSGNTGPAVSVVATANQRGVVIVPQSVTVVEGGTGDYTVALTSKPTGKVTVTVASGTPTVATVAPTSLTFTPDDWGTAQAVTVSGITDAGTSPWQRRITSVTHTASGADYTDVAAPVVTVTVVGKIDYDADDDGLIEIRTLEQLNAMRWDLNGDADPSSDAAAYAAAFPDPVTAAGSGNGALGCSNGGSASACAGYELKADLDFNTDGSYANTSNKSTWTSGSGWDPIGFSSNRNSSRFQTTFDGNGHAISHLFIDRPSTDYVGLFGHTHLSGALIRNVGLKDVNVTARDIAGALVGRHFGTLRHCYATGGVAGRNDVGGLVGINGWDNNQGGIHGSFAAVAVSGGERLGGLVGRHYGVMVSASYAAGTVSGSGNERGALIGRNWGSGNRIKAVYATGRVAGSSSSGLTGNTGGPAASASYWDTLTSGQGSSGRGVGKTTSELQTPIDYDGIYTDWNLDLDSNSSVDDPWDFGDASQYPALKADLDGNGVASVAEFGGGLGHQTPRPGLAVSKTAVTVGEDNRTEDYTVVLRTEPAADVVVALASGDTSAAAVSPPSLRFTPTTWSTAQMVTVTGVNDSIDNAGDVRETAITYTVSSTDSDYDNIAVPRLAVVVADDDTATLALSVSPTTLAEDAVATEVMVRASLSGAAIHGDLVLPLTLGGTARAGADYKVDALPVITIAGGNTTATATLSITPLDDAIDEGNEMIAIGVAHARFGPTAPAAVELTDNDDAGLTLALDRATLAEGDGATDVTVTAALTNGATAAETLVLRLRFAGTAERSDDYAVTGAKSITIAKGAPSGSTTLTVTPVSDGVDEGLGEVIEIGTVHNNAKVAATLFLADDDDEPPALSIRMAAGYSGRDPILIWFVFPEPVTGFDANDVAVKGFNANGVAVTGGTLGRLSTKDGGRTYKSKVTLADPLPDSITVTVRRDAVTDPSGNTGPAAPVVKTALYDTTVPTLEIRGLPTALHGAEPLVLVFRFSEPVEFGSGDVEVVNGQVTDFSGDGAVYLVTVTPDSGGALSVRVKRDAVADGAGNTVVPIPETAAQADGELTLSKRIVKTPGRYLQSNPRLVLPAGMVVQGAEVRYQTSLPQNSPLDVGSTTYSYAFVRKQGDVKFLAQDDDGDTATNRFRADWYGENLVEVTATDGNGKKATALDRVFVHFASRRVLGGNAEGLTDAQRLNMHRDNIHDVSKANPGMAFVLPGMDGSSEEGRKGFYQCKETRSLVTSRGTLLTVCHVGRRTGESPFFEVPWGMAVAVSRSADYGNSWSNQLLTPHDGDVTWAYTGMVEAKGVVYVYVQRVSCRSGVSRSSCSSLTSSGTLRESYYFTSGDDGRTWSSGRRQAQLSTARMTMNPVHVPGLRVDGVQAPPGEGLMAHTREENASAGYLWLSVNGGKTWKQARSSGRYNNEVGLARLENDAQHIYMVVRTNYRYDFSFKNEIVFRKGGSNGIEVVADHRQSLSNITNRSTHHWLNVIHSGPLKGTVLFSTIGPVVVDDKHEYSHTGSWNHSRNHIRLLVSREAITGAKTISAGLFDEVHVMDSMGWGQSTVQYLPADLPNSVGMGRDAFVLIGESEPIHRETYQAIDLKPDRAHRGWFHERFTNTAYLLSKEYLDQLRAVKHRVALGVSTAAGKIDSEAAGSAYSFTVRAWRSLGDALDGDLVLPLTFGGDATQGEDYEVTGDPEVTILSGARFGKTTMTITPTQDTIDEGVFEHIELSAEPAPGLTVAMVRVTLVDDDVHDLTLSANPSELVEGAVATEVTVTATLPAAASGKVTLPLSFAGSAARDVDYRLSGTGEIEIVSGQTSGSTVLTITPLADGVAEVFRENIEVRADHNGDKSAVHVLLIDSPVGVVVSEATVTMGEDGGTATYTVALGSAPAANVRVSPVSGDTTVATVSGPLTFTPDNWSTAQVVTVTGVNDSDDNAGNRRTTTITHTVGSTDADYEGAAVSEVAVVVDDDDTATLALSVNPATLAEGASTANVTVKATLTGAVLDANLALPLTLGGTAQAGVDYTVSGTAPTITIAEGNTEATASLTITPVDDDVAEGAEMIAIGVAHAKFGTTAPAQVMLTDNDTAAGLALSVDPATLVEGAGAKSVEVTAALTNGATAAETLVLRLRLAGTAERGDDYAVTGAKSITIAKGAPSGSTTLTVTPVSDGVDEGLGEVIEIGTVHNNAKVAATLFLADDDDGTPALSIRMAAGYSGRDPIPVWFVFPEPVTGFDANDVAVKGFDANGVAVTGGTLGRLSTKDGGRTYKSKVTLADPLPDSITVEVARDAAVDLSDNLGPAAVVPATANRRSLVIELSVEGWTSYTVKLNSAPTGDVTVAVASEDTGVATVLPPSLTFTASDWGTAQTVTVTGVVGSDNGVGQIREVTITHTVSGADYDGIVARLTLGVVNINKIDYDADDDGLIEIRTLEQLNAMRWDLNGNGDADSPSNAAAYAAAFPYPVADAGAGNGALGCSDSQGTAAPCTGYELKADLDFNDDASYADSSSNKASWTTSTGWAPVGGNSNPFAAAFDGNGHAISHLFIARSSTDSVGLFGHTHSSGALIRNLGLKAVNVTGNDRVGALAGRHYGTIRHCYATGTVSGAEDVGGLAGTNGLDNDQGSIYGSFAAVTVSGTKHLGGLVGQHHGVVVLASYAAGAVSGSSGAVGGLIGYATSSANVSKGRIEAVYATGRVTETGRGDADGLVGSNWHYGGTFADGYWDTGTSGQSGSVLGVGKTASELQTPIRYGGIYANWNLDLDSNSSPDDPWDFGDATQYPALKADLNGDGMATVAEFGGGLGHQAQRTGLVLSVTALTVDEDSGTETYTVALASAPKAEVVVTLASRDRTVATVSSVSPTFTTTNWNIAQRVTVTGVNDSFDNAEHRTTAITHTVTSVGDTDYNGLVAPEVAVTVTDDDTATLTLSVVPTTLAENASAANVMVKATLTGAVLEAGLALPLVLRGTAQAGVDYTVSGTAPTITILEGAAEATASLTLTPVDDAVAEGAEMIAIGVAHARFGATAPAAVELTDNDDAGLTLALNRATLAEADSATDVTVTAALLNGATAGSGGLTLPLTLGGVAARGVDYTVSGTESITITPGTSSGETTLSIDPTDDIVDEGPGELIEVGTTHSNRQVAATLFLTDDDAGAPALSIEMAAGYSSADPIPVRFVFPEPVTDFASDDVTVSAGGTLGALSTTDGGRTYLSEVAPGSPIPDSITVTVRRDAVTDQSGNTGPAAPVVKTAQHDATVPTLVIEGLPSAFHGAEPLVLVFRFSEPVEFGSNDVEVVNGQMTDFSGDGTVYLVTVTPDSGGALRVGVKQDAVADGAGNAVVPIPRTAVQADGELTLSKRIVRTPGRYLHSFDGHLLPMGMVVQGAEVRYQASLPQNSPLNEASTTYSYAFVRKQGDVEFLARDDDGNTAANRFRADWYGENLIEVTATDGNGKKATALDKVFVHFASRRVLGGDAEGLTGGERAAVQTDATHDIRKLVGSGRGMAYRPANIAANEGAGIPAKGFNKVTEPRLLSTSRGTLLVAAHAGHLRAHEAPPGQGIMVSRSTDHGNSWSELLLVQKADETWGYTAMTEVDGVVYIYASAGNDRLDTTKYNLDRRGIYYFKSTDDGLNWGPPIRHDGLSNAIGYKDGDISSVDGLRLSTNILKVPGLTVDGVIAPAGRGLLLHTYVDGYVFASVNGGVDWTRVASAVSYKNNNMIRDDAVPDESIQFWDEFAWAVLGNNDQDIYVLVRDDPPHYKNEYVISRVMTPGDLGLQFKGAHGQALRNVRAQNAHHWLTSVKTGAHAGTLLFSTPYHDNHRHKRYNAVLLVSKRAIAGTDSVGSNLFDVADVKRGVGWGQSAVEYLAANLPSPLAAGMGKDAIVLVGESEPIHKETHQIIDLGATALAQWDERYTVTAYTLSWDYLETLLNRSEVTLMVTSGAALREDGAPHDVEVQAQLTSTLPFDLVLPLEFAGAAEENVDYQVAGDKRIVIPKNNLSGIVTLSITPLADVLDEGFELIEIRAASVPGISTFAVVLDPGLGFSSFESWEGWSGYPRQLAPTVFTASPFTDAADNVWTSSVAKIMNRDEKEVRTGRQSLALSYGSSSRQGVVLDPAGADGVGVVSFYVKRFSDDTRSINLRVEYRVGQDGAWTQTFSQDYSSGDIPSLFTEVRVPINQVGDVQLQFSVAGVKGFLIDDVSVTSHK